MKKNLDIARIGRKVGKRGSDESITMKTDKNALEADLARAITVDEVLKRIRAGLARL